MSNQNIVLVAGATGKQGGAVVRALYEKWTQSESANKKSIIAGSHKFPQLGSRDRAWRYDARGFA